MYGQLENTATGTATLTNDKTIDIDMENSLGIYVKTVLQLRLNWKQQIMTQ